MATLAPVIRQRFFNANGAPLAGGKVFTYEAGTSTPLPTYTDQSGVVENTNPVILDSSGEADIWIGLGPYKFVVKTASDIVVATVDDIKPLDDNLALANIADGSITEAKIASAAVTSDKIASASIGTSKIIDLSITTAKVIDGAITTPKIANGAVTKAKITALGQQISSDSGTQVISTGGDSQITNNSVTITTTGRPVFVGLIPKESATDNAGILNASASGGSVSIGAVIYFTRGGVTVSKMAINLNPDPTSGLTTKGITFPPGCFFFIDTPAAGTYTYAARGTASTTLNINYVRLIAYEL